MKILHNLLIDLSRCLSCEIVRAASATKNENASQYLEKSPRTQGRRGGLLQHSVTLIDVLLAALILSVEPLFTTGLASATNEE